MFRQTGVIRVDEVEEIFDVASALLRQPLPRGNRVAILTGGGGFGCVTSDACERLGLDVAPLSPHTIEQLNAVLPERWPHANPVDTVAAGWVTYPCVWPLLEDENLDALLIIGGVGQMRMMMRSATTMLPPALREQAKQIIKSQEKFMRAREKEELENLDRLFEYMDKYQKPVIIFGRTPFGMDNSPVFKKLRENRVSLYPSPERAAKVLAHLVQYSRYINHL